MRQDWRCAGFFHWDYPPEALRPLIPPPLELDVYEGRAWVGLTPFLTTLSLGGVVRLPGPRCYPETNVRTYVRAPDGTDGVWFFSLDVTNLANVPLGRLGMPYFWGRLHVEYHDDTVQYRGRRRGRAASKSARYDLALRYATAEQSQDDFETFLTGRWHTYRKRLGVLARFDIEHDPWPLHRAELIWGQQGLLEMLGLPPTLTPPVVHYSPGVDASIGWPERVRDSR